MKLGCTNKNWWFSSNRHEPESDMNQLMVGSNNLGLPGGAGNSRSMYIMQPKSSWHCWVWKQQPLTKTRTPFQKKTSPRLSKSFPLFKPFHCRMFCIKIRPCPASPLPYGSPPAPTAAAVPAAETPRLAPRWAPKSPPRCCQRCRRWPWRHRGRVAGDRILADDGETSQPIGSMVLVCWW